MNVNCAHTYVAAALFVGCAAVLISCGEPQQVTLGPRAEANKDDLQDIQSDRPAHTEAARIAANVAYADLIVIDWIVPDEMVVVRLDEVQLDNSRSVFRSSNQVDRALLLCEGLKQVMVNFRLVSDPVPIQSNWLGNDTSGSFTGGFVLRVAKINTRDQTCSEHEEN